MASFKLRLVRFSVCEAIYGKGLSIGEFLSKFSQISFPYDFGWGELFEHEGGGGLTPRISFPLPNEPHQNYCIVSHLSYCSASSAGYNSRDHFRGDRRRFQVPRGSLTTVPWGLRKLQPVLTDRLLADPQWSDRPAVAARRWFNWSQPAAEFRDYRTCQSSSRTRSYSHALALRWDTVRKVRSGQPDALCRP